MRLLLIPAALLLVLASAPARSADKTERIPLRFIAATELEWFLTDGGQRNEAKGLDELKVLPQEGGSSKLDVIYPGFPIGRGLGLVPPGIGGWAVDTRGNVLSVTGTEEGIEQLKRIIRLLDIPPQRMRLSVRALKADAKVRETLRGDAGIQVGEGSVWVADQGQRQALEARPSVFSTAMVVSNNRVMHVRHPGEAGEPVVSAMIMPRINGDGSITLIMPLRMLRPGEAKPDAGGFVAFRRIPSGGTVVVLLEKQNLAWVITPEILPDPVAPEGRQQVPEGQREK